MGRGRSYLIYLGPPPRKPIRRAGIDDSKEYNNARYCRRAVQRRAEHKVELLPPRPPAALDQQPKHQADERPAAVVCARGGRDVAQPAEEERDVHAAQPSLLARERAAQSVRSHGEQETHEEEPQERAVGRTGGEEASRAERAPDGAGVEVRARKGAGEAVGGGGRADVRDVVEGPVEDGDLPEGADDEAYGLNKKQVPRGYLGWVSQPHEGRKCACGSVVVTLQYMPSLRSCAKASPLTPEMDPSEKNQMLARTLPCQM